MLQKLITKCKAYHLLIDKCVFFIIEMSLNTTDLPSCKCVKYKFDFAEKVITFSFKTENFNYLTEKTNKKM